MKRSVTAVLAIVLGLILVMVGQVADARSVDIEETVLVQSKSDISDASAVIAVIALTG